MTEPSPTTLRLDPAPSKVFTWLEWQADAPEVRSPVSGHLLQPAGPAIHVRYRTTGVEYAFWPVTLEEAQQVFNPGARYGYSIGSAFSQIVQPHKSKRMVKSGERQATVKQREEAEKRTGRRWLA